jgi:hypothetical protein
LEPLRVAGPKRKGADQPSRKSKSELQILFVESAETLFLLSGAYEKSLLSLIESRAKEKAGGEPLPPAWFPKLDCRKSEQVIQCW